MTFCFALEVLEATHIDTLDISRYHYILKYFDLLSISELILASTCLKVLHCLKVKRICLPLCPLSRTILETSVQKHDLRTCVQTHSKSTVPPSNSCSSKSQMSLTLSASLAQATEDLVKQEGKGNRHWENTETHNDAHIRVKGI